MRLITLILGILISQFSFSQTNYIPGYVVQITGDTAFGFIDYRNWSENPNRVTFKLNEGSNSIKYTPTDIVGFSVYDEIYMSGIVEYETSPFKTSELVESPALYFKLDTIFLQALYIGNKSLFYYKNIYGKEHFYIRGDTGFELLVYKKYIVGKNGQIIIKENNRYLGQLTLYLSDCPDISLKLKNTSYSKKSLKNLFQYYYANVSTDPYFQNNAEKISTEVGVLAGVSFSYLKFQSRASPTLVNAVYEEPSINVAGGLFIDILFSRNQRKWSLYSELFYSAYRTNGRYENIKNPDEYTITELEIGNAHVKLNNLLRFKYPFGKFSLFFNAGLSNGFAISETNYSMSELKTKTYIGSIVKFEEGPAILETRKYEQAIIMGLGAKFNRYSFEARFEQGNGMSGYITLKSFTQKSYFLLGYRF